MWPTVDGIRSLEGAEAELVRHAIDAVVNRLVADRNGDEPFCYGIDWFDQWEHEQKRWLLDQVSAALLTDRPPPKPAAMWEATIDVLFLEVIEQIEREREIGTRDWREMVSRVLPSPKGDNDPEWRVHVTKIADRILGVPCYQKAEAYRDQDPQMLRRFLAQRGLPDDFLEQIPPLCG